jgi:GTPase SAR1 family protein
MNTVTIENPRLVTALAYAGIGWQVIPLHWPKIGLGGTSCSCGKAECGSVGKHPLTPNGLKNASTDGVVIREWWRRYPAANVGIVTGAASGIVVLDVDPRHGGTVAISDLIDAYGELEETVQAETGSGGTHFFFAHPGGTLSNSAGKVGEGLDVRGDGGYVVAAPSLHVSGNRYSWLKAPTFFTTTPIPPWLMALMADKPKPAEPAPFRHTSKDEIGVHWLGKALAQSKDGNRNTIGFWLAQQLRDAGLREFDAGPTMRSYASLATGLGDVPYTETEAMASLRSAYSQPAREPARRINPFPNRDIKPAKPVAPKVAPVPASGASAELQEYMSAIARGEVENITWPWEQLTHWTQALLPGSAVVVCGDPGVGKTFWVLDCIRHWHKNGVPCAAFFVEKDRKFHTMRLLAQLEGQGHYVDFEWIRDNPGQVTAALERNRVTLDSIGKLIDSEPDDRVTLRSLAAWVRQMASAGKRVIVIDPITAADAGRDRWLEDDTFVNDVNKIISSHGVSLVLITHPKKGMKPGVPSSSDIAAGAAYSRFVDVNLWLHKPKKPRAVVMRHKGMNFHATPGLFVQIHKARNGRGANYELGFNFDRTLTFVEQGLVMKEAGRHGGGPCGG